MAGGHRAGFAGRHDANRRARRARVCHGLRGAGGAAGLGKAGRHDERSVGAARGECAVGIGFRWRGSRLFQHVGESHPALRWKGNHRVGGCGRRAEYADRAGARAGWNALRGEPQRAGDRVENGCAECGRAGASHRRAGDEKAHQHRVHHGGARRGICLCAAGGWGRGVGGKGGVLRSEDSSAACRALHRMSWRQEAERRAAAGFAGCVAGGRRHRRSLAGGQAGREFAHQGGAIRRQGFADAAEETVGRSGGGIAGGMGPARRGGPAQRCRAGRAADHG